MAQSSATSPRAHFTMLPNLIDDSDLDVYAFRLLAHVLRVTGTGGTCWQSTDTLAAACHMSRGKITEAKRLLVEQQYLRIEKRSGRGGVRHVITVDDTLWARNERRYAEKGGAARVASGHAVATQVESGHVVTRSQPPGGPKKIPEKITPKTKEEDGMGPFRQETACVEGNGRDAEPEGGEVRWREVLAAVRLMVALPTYQRFFAQTRWLGCDGDARTWRVAAPSALLLEVLETPRLRRPLERALRYVGAEDVRVTFVASEGRAAGVGQ
jgi:hypothetical protein